jgi:D-alanyl-D-alanine carboxypeptidase
VAARLPARLLAIVVVCAAACSNGGDGSAPSTTATPPPTTTLPAPPTSTIPPTTTSTLPPTSTQPPLRAETDAATLQGLLDAWVSDKALPGATAGVWLPDDSVWVGATGLADVPANRAMDPSDTFRVGSITKLCTAVVVLQLVDEGLVDLAEPASAVDARLDDAILWRHLLSHQIGLPDYGDDRDVSVPLASGGPTLAELVQSSIDQPLRFPPGTHHEYSNTNYALLGELLEAVTGSEYPDLLRIRVFDPAGMESSFVEAMDPGVPSAAPNGDPAGPDQDAPERAGAAGAVVTTASELVGFLHAAFAGDLIPPSLLDEATTSVADESGESARYGLGVEILEVNGAVAWGHTGGIHGYRAAAMWFPDDGIGVVVLLNALRLSNPLDLITQMHAAVADG